MTAAANSNNPAQEILQSRADEIIETRREVYGDRAERRREGLEAKADRLQGESNRIYSDARTMASAIPFGQPILVGHHSEGRDRRYRGRIHDKFGKAFSLSDQADDARRRAESVGNGISSDDPDALPKLREKLANLKDSHDKMIQANKTIRKHKDNEPACIAALQELGFTQEGATDLLHPKFSGTLGFASYALTNSNANIKNVERRIKEQEAQLQAQDKSEAWEAGVTYREDVALNRAMVIFPAKPSKEVCQLMRKNGFVYSPTNTAWQRKLSNGARYAASCVRAALAAI